MILDEYDLRIAIYIMCDFRQQVISITENEALDEIYDEVAKLTKKFRSSTYDDSNAPLCVCIEDFMKNEMEKSKWNY